MLNKTIGGKDYTFEFSIEASMYNECTENVMELFSTLSEAQTREEVKEVIKGISNIPKVAVTMFYAGLMEHHGVDGDRTVLSIGDAKRLVKQYCLEHKEDDKGDFYTIMEEMMGCMSDDGFFELMGLAKMMRQTEEKLPKTPQDHKRKAIKK